MLEPQPLHGIGKLDVDAEIVGIELELIAVEQPGVLVDVHEELGDIAVEFQLPVAIARGLCLEIDAFGHDGATPNRLRARSYATGASLPASRGATICAPWGKMHYYAYNLSHHAEYCNRGLRR